LEILEVVELRIMGLDAIKELVASLLKVRVNGEVKGFEIGVKRNGRLFCSEF
jgi:hypothetical protein